MKRLFLDKCLIYCVCFSTFSIYKDFNLTVALTFSRSCCPGQQSIRKDGPQSSCLLYEHHHHCCPDWNNHGGHHPPGERVEGEDAPGRQNCTSDSCRCLFGLNQVRQHFLQHWQRQRCYFTAAPSDCVWLNENGMKLLLELCCLSRQASSE